MSSTGMYSQPAQSKPGFFASMGGVGKGLVVVAGVAILAMAALFIYNAVRVTQGLPSTNLFGPVVTADQTPMPVDGKKGTTISASSIPLTQGSDYGIQFWMYIQDWDYNFGKEKMVLQRVDPTNNAVASPKITLHPTDNSLNVSVSIYASSGAAAASSPAPSNNTSASGDMYTCTVENVPLQSWFAVSVTVFQRNLEVYINGKLVKSCVLPGVPKPAVGDIQIATLSGFSGSVCNVHSYPNVLAPIDAEAFYLTGTSCGSTTPTSTKVTPTNTMKIFGYTFTFGVLDKTGKELSKYTF